MLNEPWVANGLVAITRQLQALALAKIWNYGHIEIKVLMGLITVDLFVFLCLRVLRFKVQSFITSFIKQHSVLKKWRGRGISLRQQRSKAVLVVVLQAQ